MILCLSIMYLIIPVHAQYTIYHPRRCSSMFVFVFVIVLVFHTLVSSVVFAIIVDSLVSVPLNSKGYR